MATEKQVQSLAKKMASLIGKMDLEVETRTIASSQEVANNELSRELFKKNIKND